MEKPDASASLGIVGSAEPIERSQINWNLVFYFSEIAAAGSIKEAADKLKLSPSTLSVHLAQLEKDLSVQLFHRRHRKLTLTAEGNRLFFRAKEMFEVGQRLLNAVSPAPIGTLPVSIGLVPSPSIHIAYRIIGKCLQTQRHLNMKLFHSDYQELESGIASAKFDFGFSDRRPERHDIGSFQIAKSPIRFFVAEKWANTDFSELLSQLPILICNAEPTQKSFVEQALVNASLNISSMVTSDYPSALFQLCQDGLGIGVFSEAEGLTSLRVPKGAPRVQDNLYLLWSVEAEHTAACRMVRSFVQGSTLQGTA